MIIDAHCHAGPGDGFTGPADSDAPLDRYLERAAAARIGHVVLLAAFHSDYAVANEVVAQIVGGNRTLFSGLAFVHALRDRGRILPLVTRAVRVHGFRGIKCHRYDARITREVCDTARALRVPVLYDVMGEVESVELFAPLYRDVTFIIPHLGSYGDDWRAQHTFIDTLARHENVVTDTSGVRRFDLLEQAVRRAGPRKILFGSDGPWLHPGLELAKIRALHLPPPAAALIEGGNAARIFRISTASHSSATSLNAPGASVA
jgi:uncharacterized protein